MTKIHNSYEQIGINTIICLSAKVFFTVQDIESSMMVDHCTHFEHNGQSTDSYPIYHYKHT